MGVTISVCSGHLEFQKELGSEVAMGVLIQELDVRYTRVSGVDLRNGYLMESCSIWGHDGLDFLGGVRF